MNIVLFGKPGSGKGTQAKYLENKYDLVTICTGDLIRKHMKDKTQLGLIFSEHIAKGHLVPSELAFELVQLIIDDNPYCKGFIFDGSPRTVAEATLLDAFLLEMGKKIDVVIGLEVEDDEILVERILNRGKTSGRVDDCNEVVTRERLVEYERKTSPVIDYFKTVGIYRAVDANQDLLKIQKDIDSQIKLKIK